MIVFFFIRREGQHIHDIPLINRFSKKTSCLMKRHITFVLFLARILKEEIF